MYRIKVLVLVLVAFSAFMLLNAAYVSMHMTTYRSAGDTLILTPRPDILAVVAPKPLNFRYWPTYCPPWQRSSILAQLRR